MAGGRGGDREEDKMYEHVRHERFHLHENEDQKRIAGNYRNIVSSEVQRDAESANYRDRLDHSESWNNLAANAHHKQYETNQAPMTRLPSTIKC